MPDSDDKFPLATTPEVLLGLPVSEALAESDKAEAWNYGQVFYEKAKKAEAEGNSAAGTAWRLLGQLSQVGMQEGNPEEPFQPMYQGPGGRSILPGDLDDVTAEAVQRLAGTIADAELRARLSDITWDRLRDPEAARQAVQNYVESANRLFDPDHWVAYAVRIERALRLARQLRDHDLIEVVLDVIEQRVIALNGDDPLYLTSRLMELLHQEGRSRCHDADR